MTSSVKAYYLHEHDQNPLILHAPADADVLVDALLTQTWEHETAALYHLDRPVNPLGLPDHELEVTVNPDSETGALRYMGDWQNEAGTWFSEGDSGKSGTVLHFYMGTDNDWPADSDIPLEVVRAAVKEFLSTAGERPTCVRWQPHWSMLRDNPGLQGSPP